MISILILTKNEAGNIARVIESVSWSDDIHVLDSFSTDGTQEIARGLGARVTERVFDNWSAHQNWAVRNLPFKHPWVFYLDADEYVTEALRREIEAAVMLPNGKVAFRVQRRDFFWGTWLRHVQASAYYMRLFRPEKMRYERLVNPVSIADGPVGQIAGYLDHNPFSKGVGDWLDRHNKYSTFEAMQIIENRRAQHDAFRWSASLKAALSDRDFHRRRYHQKELFYRLPARPLIKFLMMYVGKAGFLDGMAGLRYAALQSIYEYMIVLKTHELESKQQQAGRQG